MSTSVISYKIEDEQNKIRYLKKINNEFNRDILSLKSDQKILFIYDKNMYPKFGAHFNEKGYKALSDEISLFMIRFGSIDLKSTFLIVGKSPLYLG